MIDPEQARREAEARSAEVTRIRQRQATWGDPDMPLLLAITAAAETAVLALLDQLEKQKAEKK